MNAALGRRGFVLLTALLCLLLIGMLALTAASLALLARRSSASALAIARADALAEADPAEVLPIPAGPGQTLTLVSPAPPGWATTRQVTRLGAQLLLVRSTAELSGPGGVAIARSALARLLIQRDTLPPTPLPGGWFGSP